MSNILNEPPSDVFEDNLLEFLAKYNNFTVNDIKEGIIYSHNLCGGNEGEENFTYGIYVINEYTKQKDSDLIKLNNNQYKWRA